MADVTGTFYASEAFIGYGAEFYVGQGEEGSPAAETFTAVPEVMSITPLVSMTVPVIDVTHLRSPDRHREKIAGIADSGPIVVTGNFRPSHGAHLLAGGDGFNATHNLQALRSSGCRNNYQIVLPEESCGDVSGSPATATMLPLVGVVTKYELGEITLEGKLPFTLEVTPTRAYYAR